jgi:cellulose synthase/poly-beta-1,6-N-acetylglucosamine synthase-like glycosyltransferase
MISLGATALLALKVLLTVMVLVGAAPLVASCFQFLLIGLHRRATHYGQIRIGPRLRMPQVLPRTAIVVPAWNEGAVIGATVDRLVGMDYPEGALRVYVVDDASTDDTPDVLRAKEAEYPGRVFCLRREKGGEGKAHTLNHGLRVVLADDWAEAVLIIDADVLFEDDALRRMSRHLPDPRIGAVTAYIKEGSAPGNYMTRFIAFEYITAQAAARRAQNVLGGLACLAGGAQLHSRESLEGIGGQIDTSSLAEDTFTTFKTQLAGRRALFEGNATVWAEEPADILGLWKQRLRWARGNVQLTKAFRRLWFNRDQHAVLGSRVFGFLWFTLFLMPLLMISAAVGLVSLFFVDFPLSWKLFNLLWLSNALTYLFVTLYSFVIDPHTARRCWVQGFLFPGLISLGIILYAMYPPLFTVHAVELLAAADLRPTYTFTRGLILFTYAWLALCMVAAYGAKWIEKRGRWGWLARPLLYVAGYGPLLCAITLASYAYELQGREMKWDKTEKTGKVALLPS